MDIRKEIVLVKGRPHPITFYKHNLKLSGTYFRNLFHRESHPRQEGCSSLKQSLFAAVPDGSASITCSLIAGGHTGRLLLLLLCLGLSRVESEAVCGCGLHTLYRQLIRQWNVSQPFIIMTSVNNQILTPNF